MPMPAAHSTISCTKRTKSPTIELSNEEIFCIPTDSDPLLDLLR